MTDEYSQFIWHDLASKMILDKLEEGESPPEEQVAKLAEQLEEKFKLDMTDETLDAAASWVEGLANIPVNLVEPVIFQPKSTMIFSVLGANLMAGIVDEMDMPKELVTVERQRNATMLLREYTMIMLWLGGNLEQLEREVPVGTD